MWKESMLYIHHTYLPKKGPTFDGGRSQDFNGFQPSSTVFSGAHPLNSFWRSTTHNSPRNFSSSIALRANSSSARFCRHLFLEKKLRQCFFAVRWNKPNAANGHARSGRMVRRKLWSDSKSRRQSVQPSQPKRAGLVTSFFSCCSSLFVQSLGSLRQEIWQPPNILVGHGQPNIKCSRNLVEIVNQLVFIIN